VAWSFDVFITTASARFQSRHINGVIPAAAKRRTGTQGLHAEAVVHVTPGFRVSLCSPGMTVVGFTNTKGSTAARHGGSL